MPNSKQEAYHILIQPPWNNGRSDSSCETSPGGQCGIELGWECQLDCVTPGGTGLFDAVVAADQIQAAILAWSMG